MTRHNNKRGFNLIEAAIVLAVVGGVIGGIWVSAAAVIENWKVNKTVEGVFSTARNVQNLISVSDGQAMGTVGFTSGLISSFTPKDWKTKDPFGGWVSVGNELSGLHGALFYIGLSSIPKTSCVNLTVKFTAISATAGNRNSTGWNYSTGSNIGRFRIVNSGNHTFDTFPISADTASSVCEEDNSILMYFNYTRNN